MAWRHHAVDRAQNGYKDMARLVLKRRERDLANFQA